MDKKKIIFGTGALLCALFVTIFSSPKAVAAEAFTYKLLEQFPGFFNQGDSPSFPQLLSALYSFGIWTVGIAAFFMLVIGGFMYITSAGNTSMAGSAKKVITDAILGLVAALVAYLVLYVVNPDLVNLNLNLISVGITSQGVQYEEEASGGTYGGGGICTGVNVGCCKVGTKCNDCNNCMDYSNSYANLCYKGAAGNTGCKLNASLIDKLNRANLGSVDAEVSEAWPPTVMHDSPCHRNGTCADVRCKNGCVNETPANIKKVYDALKAAGLSTVFESKNCAPYSAIGVYCKSYSTMTSPSFHVNM